MPFVNTVIVHAKPQVQNRGSHGIIWVRCLSRSQVRGQGQGSENRVRTGQRSEQLMLYAVSRCGSHLAPGAHTVVCTLPNFRERVRRTGHALTLLISSIH